MDALGEGEKSSDAVFRGCNNDDGELKSDEVLLKFEALVARYGDVELP